GALLGLLELARLLAPGLLHEPERPHAGSLPHRILSVRRALPGALVLAVALGAAARADTVLLKDGRELEGTVIEDGPTVVKLRVQRGTGTAVIDLARADVRLVTKKGSDPQKLAADAQEALALGHHD